MHKKIVGIACCFILPLILLASLVQLNATTIAVQPKIELKDIKIWQIGSSDSTNSISSQSRQMNLKVNNLAIQSFNTNNTLKEAVLNRASIIILDSNFLAKNDSQALQTFINATVRKAGAIVAVGEASSKLYEILNKAKIYSVPQDENGNLRNPGANFLVVGFTLKPIEVQGKVQYVVGHFASNSTNASELMNDLESFLNHDVRSMNLNEIYN